MSKRRSFLANIDPKTIDFARVRKGLEDKINEIKHYSPAAYVKNAEEEHKSLYVPAMETKNVPQKVPTPKENVPVVVKTNKEAVKNVVNPVNKNNDAGLLKNVLNRLDAVSEKNNLNAANLRENINLIKDNNNYNKVIDEISSVKENQVQNLKYHENYNRLVDEIKDLKGQHNNVSNNFLQDERYGKIIESINELKETQIKEVRDLGNYGRLVDDLRELRNQQVDIKDKTNTMAEMVSHLNEKIIDLKNMPAFQDATINKDQNKNHVAELSEKDLDNSLYKKLLGDIRELEIYRNQINGVLREPQVIEKFDAKFDKLVNDFAELKSQMPKSEEELKAFANLSEGVKQLQVQMQEVIHTISGDNKHSLEESEVEKILEAISHTKKVHKNSGRYVGDSLSEDITEIRKALIRDAHANSSKVDAILDSTKKFDKILSKISLNEEGQNLDSIDSENYNAAARASKSNKAFYRDVILEEHEKHNEKLNELLEAFRNFQEKHTKETRDLGDYNRLVDDIRDAKNHGMMSGMVAEKSTGLPAIDTAKFDKISDEIAKLKELQLKEAKDAGNYNRLMEEIKEVKNQQSGIENKFNKIENKLDNANATDFHQLYVNKYNENNEKLEKLLNEVKDIKHNNQHASSGYEALVNSLSHKVETLMDNQTALREQLHKERYKEEALSYKAKNEERPMDAVLANFLNKFIASNKNNNYGFADNSFDSGNLVKDLVHYKLVGNLLKEDGTQNIKNITANDSILLDIAAQLKALGNDVRNLPEKASVNKKDYETIKEDQASLVNNINAAFNEKSGQLSSLLNQIKNKDDELRAYLNTNIKKGIENSQELGAIFDELKTLSKEINSIKENYAASNLKLVDEEVLKKHQTENIKIINDLKTQINEVLQHNSVGNLEASILDIKEQVALVKDNVDNLLLFRQDKSLDRIEELSHDVENVIDMQEDLLFSFDEVKRQVVDNYKMSASFYNDSIEILVSLKEKQELLLRMLDYLKQNNSDTNNKLMADIAYLLKDINHRNDILNSILSNVNSNEQKQDIVELADTVMKLNLKTDSIVRGNHDLMHKLEAFNKDANNSSGSLKASINAMANKLNRIDEIQNITQGLLANFNNEAIEKIVANVNNQEVMEKFLEFSKFQVEGINQIKQDILAFNVSFDGLKSAIAEDNFDTKMFIDLGEKITDLQKVQNNFLSKYHDSTEHLLEYTKKVDFYFSNLDLSKLNEIKGEIKKLAHNSENESSIKAAVAIDASNEKKKPDVLANMEYLNKEIKKQIDK